MDTPSILRFGCLALVLLFLGEFVLIAKELYALALAVPVILAFLMIGWAFFQLIVLFCRRVAEEIGWGKQKEPRQRQRKREASRHISSKVKMYVWRRDFGRCVMCGSKENLEYDHIIPFSKGGSNTERNIQLLCLKCNRQKHNRIV